MASELGVDLGQIGGRGGKYYLVNVVWQVFKPDARRSALGAFSPYLPSTALQTAPQPQPTINTTYNLQSTQHHLHIMQHNQQEVLIL